MLSDEDGAYRRLHRVMDAWCALWFWPLTTDVSPPSWDAWLDGLEALAGKGIKETAAERAGQTSFTGDMSWRDLDDAEVLDRQYAGALPVAEALERCPWLAVAGQIADDQGFFHWELDFAQVFARGGFDLQAGNPPWVRPHGTRRGVLAEFDPWWQLAANPSEREKKERRVSTLALPGARDWLLDERAEQAGTNAHLGSSVDRPLLHGLQPDLYRCFMDRTWRCSSPSGDRLPDPSGVALHGAERAGLSAARRTAGSADTGSIENSLQDLCERSTTARPSAFTSTVQRNRARASRTRHGYSARDSRPIAPARRVRP